MISQMAGPGGAVNAPRSGYLQFIHRRTLVHIAAEVDAVVYLRYRPGHFLVQGHPYATVWPPGAAAKVAREMSSSHVIGPDRNLARTYRSVSTSWSRSGYAPCPRPSMTHLPL